MNNVSAMVEIFHKGGYVMYILLLLSLAVVAIAIDRYLFFKRSDSGRQFAREFYGLLHQKEYAQAFALARESHGTMAEVICEAADGYLEVQDFRSGNFYLNQIFKRIYTQPKHL